MDRHDALVKQGLSAFVDGTGKSQYRNAGRLCPPTDTDRRLAPHRLAIQAAFPSNHQISAFEVSVEFQRIEHNVYTRAQLGIEEAQESRPQSAGGPGARQIDNSPASGVKRHLGKSFQTAVQMAHRRWIGTFLGSEDDGRPVFANQRVINVTGNPELGLGQPGVKRVKIDAPDIGKGGAARWQLLAISVKESGAQGLEHACPGIVGGTATEGDNKLPGAPIKRFGDEFAGAPRGGP